MNFTILIRFMFLKKFLTGGQNDHRFFCSDSVMQIALFFFHNIFGNVCLVFLIIRIFWFTDKFDLNEPTYPYFFRFLAVLFLGLRIRLSFMCRLIRTFFRFLMILILDIRIIYLCISFLIRTHHAKEILKSQIVRIKSCFKTNLIRTSLETH